MAKRKHNFVPSSEKPKELNLQEIIANTEIENAPPPIYANHAEFSINPHDIVIDFIRIEPTRSGTGKIQAVLVQRIMIPLGLGKGFATGLANLIAGFESALGVKIPSHRSRMKEDTIEIWSE